MMKSLTAWLRNNMEPRVSTRQPAGRRSGHFRSSLLSEGRVAVEAMEDRVMLFALDSGWPLTATNPFGTLEQYGSQPTLTWGIVDDGTPVLALGSSPSESSDDSDLVSFLNGIYGIVTDDTDYTDEIWFQHFQDSFDRWSELSGVTFIYADYDDGATFRSSAFDALGVLGTRADIRIGGHSIDGNSGVLAYAFGAPHGEMVIDTSDSFYSNLTDNSVRLRNTITHELGHGLGLEHPSSGTEAILMEAFTNSAIDGPQFDDILGIQRLYGDADEKLNNDDSANAIALGTLGSGSSLTAGIDTTSMTVLPDTVGFISIDDESDLDFYSFSTSGATTVDITLSPTGFAYSVGLHGGSESTYDALAQQDLELQLIGTDGVTVLASADLNAAGFDETISGFNIPAAGTYFARISGATTDTIQTYMLTVADLSGGSDSLTVTIDETSVSEAAGNAAATGTVTRNSADLSSPLTVNLNSDNTGAATVAATVVIPAGQSSVTFDVNAVDDSLVDGPQDATITGSATNYASDNADITVTDDDTLALTVTLDETSVSEAAGNGAATGTVTRNSADLSSPLTVNLNSDNTGAATVAATVVIPAGQSSVTFDVNAVDDSVVDGPQDATITGSATNYASDNADITVTDDDTLALTVTIDETSVSEGAGNAAATGTVTRNSADLSSPLTVNLNSDNTGAATVAATVVIPAGQSSVTFDVNAVDDSLVDGPQDATITGSATNYASDNADITVTDDDTLALTVTLDETSVSEGAGNAAATGTVTRNSADLSSPLTVNLNSDNTGAATVAATVVIPAGQSSVTFDVNAVDDSVVDGPQDATITGSATNYASDNADITVTDDDTLALTVTIDETSVSEGAGNAAATGTVTRNSADLSSPLTVNLNSDNTGAATVAATVVIPAGQSSVTFDVNAVDDSLVDGPQDATITGSATNYVSDNADITVTNDEVLTTDSQFEFHWDSIPGAEGYEVWYTYVATGQSPYVQEIVSTNSFTPSSPLAIGTYFLWSRMRQDDGSTGSWSTGITVTVAPPVQIDAMAYQQSDSTPTISWQPLAGATRYEVWANNITTGQMQVITDSNVTATTFTPSAPLSLGSHRIWVRGYDASGLASTWSEPLEISLGPQPVGPLSPTFETTPTFEWTSVPGAATYDLYLSTSSGTISETGLTGTSWTPSGALPAGTLRWWVRGVTADSKPGSWSDRVDSGIGGKPYLLSPAGNIDDASPHFTWSPVIGATRYDLYVSRLDAPAGVVIREDVLTTSFTGSILAAGDYRVWVRAFDGSNTAGLWSSGLDFTVASAAGVLTTSPVSPLTATFDTTPQFDWSVAAGASSYELYLTDGTTIVEETGLTATSFQQATALSTGNWTWWVRALDGNGDPGPWSAPSNLHVGGQTSILSPVGVAASSTPTFEWGAVQAAGRYILHVATVSGTVVIREDNLTSTSFTASSALASGDYRVWIKAIDGSDDTSGVWSVAVTFTVVSADTEVEVPDDLLALHSKGSGSSVTAGHQLVLNDVHRDHRPSDRAATPTRTTDGTELDVHSPWHKNDSVLTLDAELVDQVMRDGSRLMSDLDATTQAKRRNTISTRR